VDHGGGDGRGDDGEQDRAAEAGGGGGAGNRAGAVVAVVDPNPCAGPPAVPAELADRLSWLLPRAGQLVGAAVSGVLVTHDVTPRELSVLATAAPHPRPQLGLAVAVGLDKTTMVSTVDALERRGLVRREQWADDRRVRLVAVTEQGLALVEAATEAVARAEAEVLSVLPDGDRERLLPLLRALVTGVRGGPPPGSCV
jgi:DNA-binding MarR family transcriptional regulator